MASELKPCICGKTPRLDIKKGLAGITKVPFYREQIMCRCGVSSKIFKAPRKAVEAWNTRPTPQETAMQELNHHVGYSRENECWFIRFYPYQTEQQAKDAVSAFRSPTPQETDKAPVEGLVTQWRSPREMLEAFGADNIREGSRAVLGDGIEEDELEDYLEAPIHVLQKILAELVTRSQAEAIIAAERAEKEEARRAEEEAKDCFWSIYETYLEKGGLPVSTEGARSALSNRIASLEADNAAKDARIKEYETGLVDFHREMSALETKFAAAQKALEPFVSFFNEAMKGFTEGYAERTPSDKPVLGWNNAYLLMRNFIDARAVLGGKPS